MTIPQASDLWNRFAASEEIHSEKKDAYGRFLHSHSKVSNPLLPEVSDYLLENGFTPKFPENKKFALLCTHDIDLQFTRKTLRQWVGSIMRNIGSLQFGKAAGILIEGPGRVRIPQYDIQHLIEAGKETGALSTYFFLSLKPEDEDFNYRPSELTDAFEKIRQTGSEIGLHGGHAAYNNQKIASEEKIRLEEACGVKVNGYRNHYLRFSAPHTWQILSDLSFSYDSTFGYADHAGFRNGMCHPFQPWNENTGTFMDIVEIPLALMDQTLFKYMKMEPEKQLEFCQNLIDTVAARSGVLCLLWHNSEMQAERGKLYRDILKYAAGKGAWMPTCSQLLEHWKSEGYLRQTGEILFKLKNQC